MLVDGGLVLSLSSLSGSASRLHLRDATAKHRWEWVAVANGREGKVKEWLYNPIWMTVTAYTLTTWSTGTSRLTHTNTPDTSNHQPPPSSIPPSRPTSHIPISPTIPPPSPSLAHPHLASHSSSSLHTPTHLSRLLKNVHSSH